MTKIISVFDQLLYAKAAEVTWTHPDKFKTTIIIRPGVFRPICTLLANVGKRFQDAGLQDRCIESDVIADGSISGVMDGPKYKRAVRLHKLVYEALIGLAWKGFLSWLQAKHTDDVIDMDETLKTIGNLCKDVSQVSLKQVLQNMSCARIMHFPHHALPASCTCLKSTLNSCELEMPPNLLAVLSGHGRYFAKPASSIKRIDQGRWMLHLAFIRAMIPWCFAYNRHDYAHYLPYHYAKMTQLSVEHRDVHAEFMQGGFTVQLVSRKKPF